MSTIEEIQKLLERQLVPAIYGRGENGGASLETGYCHVEFSDSGRVRDARKVTSDGAIPWMDGVPDDGEGPDPGIAHSPDALIDRLFVVIDDYTSEYGKLWVKAYVSGHSNPVKSVSFAVQAPPSPVAAAARGASRMATDERYIAMVMGAMGQMGEAGAATNELLRRHANDSMTSLKDVLSDVLPLVVELTALKTKVELHDEFSAAMARLNIVEAVIPTINAGIEAWVEEAKARRENPAVADVPDEPGALFEYSLSEIARWSETAIGAVMQSPKILTKGRLQALGLMAEKGVKAFKLASSMAPK